MKVCELSDESPDVMRTNAKAHDVFRLSEMYQEEGETQDVSRGLTGHEETYSECIVDGRTMA